MTRDQFSARVGPETFSVQTTLRVMQTLADLGSVAACRFIDEYKWYKIPDLLDVKPASYCDAFQCFLDTQANALVKKNQDFKFGIDTAAAALSSFLEGEDKCRLTNDRVQSSVESIHIDSFIKRVFFLMKNYTQKVLGPCPLPTDIHFGPGSTLECRSYQASIANKLETGYTMYSHTPMVFLKHLMNHNHHYASLVHQASQMSVASDLGPTCALRHVTCSEWFSVPKDWKTDRSCELGAGINAVLQRFYGIHICARLDRFHDLPLHRRPEEHVRLSRHASLFGDLVTKDLKNASNTIARETVRNSLEHEWYSVLNRIRSHYIKLPTQSEPHKLEMFSAMGNGFTFELETLLFEAACWTAVQLDGKGTDSFYTVFGDDIIINARHSETLDKVLDILGFEINQTKSFTHGPFRESCGGDFFLGANVRPTFFRGGERDIKNKVLSDAYTFTKLANRIRSIATHILDGYGCHSGFLAAWQDVVDRIPQHLRCFGPAALGDSVINCSREEWIGFATYRNCKLRIKRLHLAPSKEGRGRSRTPQGKLAFGLFLLQSDLNEKLYLRKKHDMLEAEKMLSACHVEDGQVLRSTKSRLVTRNIEVSNHIWEQYNCSFR